MPPLTATARALGLGLLALATASCTLGPAPRPVPAGEEPPWRIPAAAYGSQRLYRVSYSGPEGEGSFRLTLRLAGPQRYQVRAVDPVGRALWSLDVAQERGLWLDHRARVSCLFEGRFDLSGVPLAPFPLVSLPSLLLGRLPAEPAGEPEQSGREITYRDASDRLWTATLSARGDGLVERWTVADAEGPAAWWTRGESWSILSDRRRKAQVRWREVLREEVGEAPAALEAPAGYAPVECREAYQPDPPQG